MQDSSSNKQGNPQGNRIETIISPSNNTLKHLKSLMAKKYREEHHQFIAEGRKMVSEALSSELTVDTVVFSETFAKQQTETALHVDADYVLVSAALAKGIRCIGTTDSVFSSISDTQTPQGVLAVVKEKEYDLEKVIGQTDSFLILLDGVRDPGNLGTILRTVDAADGDGVILINDCVDPYNPKAVRSTMGSIFRVPIFHGINADDVAEKLKQNGYHIVTSHLHGSDVFGWPGGHARTALVIGSESHGVSQQMTDCADSLIKIPMAGGAESLNASVAAGILIYEIFRKGRKMDV
jgi:TrmH family RNA methyltransferase